MLAPALIVCSALVGIHGSALSPLNGPDYVRGFVRGVDGVGVDPASVAGADGLELQYRHRIVRDEGGLGRLGGFAAVPVSRLVLFGGYEWFQIPRARFERGTIGLSAVIFERLWAGVSFRGLSSPYAELRGGVWNVGLYSELFSWLTLSAGIDGFNRPRLLGGDVRPDYVFGASLRPILGEPWLTLGSEMRVSAGLLRSYNVHLTRAIVDVSPWPGVHVNASYQHTVDELLPTSRLQSPWSHQLWVGLSLSLAGTEVRGSSVALREGLGADPLLADNQLAVTVRLRPSESLFTPGGRTVEVPLTGDLEHPAGLLDPGSPIATVLYDLYRLTDDDTVDTVILSIGKLEVGMATVDELRAVIKRLRATNKTVVAKISTADDKVYAVAAAADRIYMDPVASLVVDGFAVALRYYADALAKIGVSFEAVGIGVYKTGPDSLVRATPRPEELEVQGEIVSQAYGTLMQALVEDRGLSKAAAEERIATGLFTAVEAQKAGLIDDFTTPPDPAAAPLYLPRGSALRKDSRPSRRWSALPRVRVIPVVGTIVSRAGDNILPGPTAAAEEIVPAIEDAMRDPDVAAVVLRVESPGGDVLASDIIWRAVRTLGEVKPVVVSMGDVAASGGYYVSAPAHRIYAQPNTVTGSIGIFVLRAQLSKLFDMLDIRTEVVKKGEHADINLLERPLAEEDRSMIQRNIQAFYDTFVGKVAVGRGMKVTQVETIAQGRVYTGSTAKDLGLVDAIGGLGDAVREAKRLAGYDEGDDVLVELPKHPRSVTRMLMTLTGLASASQTGLPELVTDAVQRLTAWDGRPMAILPVRYEVDRF